MAVQTSPASAAPVSSAMPASSASPSSPPPPLSRELPPLTKIVATLGPATDDPAALRRLIERGVNVCRLNFSHGSFEDHAKRLATVRAISDELCVPVAVLGDLQGPKIRVGRTSSSGVTLRAGQEVVFRHDLAEAIDGETPVLPCTYEKLVSEVAVGHRVLINDGAIRMLATEAADDELRCRVTLGGLVTTGKGVNLPDSDISAPAITDRDWECVRWAVEHELDFLALSFVRHGSEVRTLKKGLASLCEGGVCGQTLSGAKKESIIPVIAKIEKPKAIENIDEILEEADGLMVARGDLGVEMDLAQVPVIQKILIDKAHEFGKPSIVATQMLETMIESSSPTRAEASDVANAIFDGADAIMLSGETAVGKHGPLAVEMMRRIALATSARLREMPASSNPPARFAEANHRTAALAHGAWHIAEDVDARLVGVWSQNGGAARYLSRVGFRIPIIAYSSNPKSVRRMALLHGVTPVLVNKLPKHRSQFAVDLDRYIIEHGYAAEGDSIVTLAGKPFGTPGVVNSIDVHRVGASAD